MVKAINNKLQKQEYYRNSRTQTYSISLILLIWNKNNIIYILKSLKMILLVNSFFWLFFLPFSRQVSFLTSRCSSTPLSVSASYFFRADKSKILFTTESNFSVMSEITCTPSAIFGRAGVWAWGWNSKAKWNDTFDVWRILTKEKQYNLIDSIYHMVFVDFS